MVVGTALEYPSYYCLLLLSPPDLKSSCHSQVLKEIRCWNYSAIRTWQPRISQGCGTTSGLAFHEQRSVQQNVQLPMKSRSHLSPPLIEPPLLLFLLQSLHYVPKSSKSLLKALHLIALYFLNGIFWGWPIIQIETFQEWKPHCLLHSRDFSGSPSFPASVLDSLLVLILSAIRYKWSE